MMRYTEYVDRWPSPNRVASIARQGTKKWRVILTDYRRKSARIKEEEFYAVSLTSAQGKARSFIAGSSQP